MQTPKKTVKKSAAPQNAGLKKSADRVEPKKKRFDDDDDDDDDFGAPLDDLDYEGIERFADEDEY